MILRIFQNMFSKMFSKNKASKNDFSDFLYKASSREKKKLFKRVVSQANEDQQKLVVRSEEIASRARLD